MPASLPGATLAQNQANPSQGASVLFCPLSGPKASPLDARTIASWSGGTPTYAADILNCSTGGLNTGIGFGSPPIFNPGKAFTPGGSLLGFSSGNFTDDYIAGRDQPDSSTANSNLLYIGGGREVITSGKPVNTPYATASLGLCMAGNGGSRDGGTTPFTGFPVKTVTTTGTVANGADIETGFANRSGVSMVTGLSAFGSSGTPLTDIT